MSQIDWRPFTRLRIVRIRRWFTGVFYGKKPMLRHPLTIATMFLILVFCGCETRNQKENNMSGSESDPLKFGDLYIERSGGRMEA
jgi:hypothetical protein